MEPYQLLAYFRRSAYGKFLSDYVQRKITKAITQLEEEKATAETAARVTALRAVYDIIFVEPYSE